MAEYYVKAGEKGDGSAAAPFGALAQAVKVVQPGDVVHMMGGVYRELLPCRIPDVTWQAVEGETPIIDGGWDGGRVSGTINQVAISGTNVTLRGLHIRNAPGRGVGISASGVRLLDCHIDNCSNAGISANGSTAKGISGLVIAGNILTRLGMGRAVGDRANGAMIFVRVSDSRIEHNWVSGGHGEGINVDKGSFRLYVGGNIVHTLAHVHLYFNRCVDCLAEKNLIFHTLDANFHHRDGWPAGVVFGDERAGGDSFPWQSGNRFIGNVVVGVGKLLQVRNNLKDPGGYDTQLNGHEIAHNTFIAGPGTEAGIEIQENQRGRPHRDSVFRDNVIYGNVGSTCNAAGLTFSHNAWTVTPPTRMLSSADVLVSDMRLSAPETPITGNYEAADFSVENYRPRLDSPLVGAAGDGTTIGALEPTEQPDETDPGPDYAWLYAEVAAVKERIAAAGVAVGDALLRIDEMIALLQQKQAS